MEKRIVTKAAIDFADTGHVSGIAWVFGQPASTGDVIEPGALTFAKSVPMVEEHDDSRVVGIWSDFSEDSEKLTVKGSLFTDAIRPARTARERAKAKKVTGLSLRFMSDSYEPNSHGGTTFHKATVTEISLCRNPVHPAARITAVKSKDASMDDENQPDIAALETQVNDLTEKLKAFDGIDKIEERIEKKIGDRLTKIEAKANRPGDEKTATDDEAAKEVKKAFGTYLRFGNAAPAESLKALTVSSDPGAGYLAPAEFSTEMIREITEVSPIRRLASVRTTTAPSVSYPRRTGITNAKWKGETQTQEASEPAFGQLEIPTRELNTYTDISNQLLADSGGQAEAEVRMALAEDFAAKEGAAFIKGDGVLSPEGLMVASGVGYTFTGNASTLGTSPADKLIDMFYSLKSAYRGNATWLMNSKTAGEIRKLKDGTTGVFLWQPAFAAGEPPTILGRPVVIDEEIADIGSGAEPIVLGDFNAAYRIVDRVEMTVLVNPYLLATDGITRIHATRRTGGKLIQPAALRKLRCATS